MLFFSLSIGLNMCFGFSKELSHWAGSFELPEHMFWLRNKKLIVQLHTLIWGPALSIILQSSAKEDVCPPPAPPAPKLSGQDKREAIKAKARAGMIYNKMGVPSNGLLGSTVAQW